MPTNVKIITNVNYILWLFFVIPWWISELVLWSLLRVFITTSNYCNRLSFNLIFTEAVIMSCVIVSIFQSIAYTTDISGVIFEEQHVANNMKCSLVFSAFRRARWEQNRIIRVTRLIWFESPTISQYHQSLCTTLWPHDRSQVRSWMDQMAGSEKYSAKFS